jgi:glycerate 2-kinase
MNTDQIRIHPRKSAAENARAIFAHALAAVDPRKAVQQAHLELSDRPIYAVAVGKAATSMALGLEDAVGEKLKAGVLTSSVPLNSRSWQSFAGSHPLPNENSLAAAQAAFTLLDRANLEEATVIFLISGGGSAMIEWPVSAEITLADLQAANRVLVSCGASIAEINAVRRAFSAVKGGALARRAPRAQMFTLIVSDTNPGDEASVASGPTLDPPPHSPNATEVVEHYKLSDVLPQSIVNAVNRSQKSTGKINGAHLVLLDNQTAVDAAANKAREFAQTTKVLGDVNEQPIQQGCDLLVSSLLAHRSAETFCAISGGEFSCPVRGDGRGGRNLETALRCAISLNQQRNEHFVVLSAGTDGIDGNSSAAGAIADETTLPRARSLGLDPHEYLARSDSYTLFERLGDLIVTGPTGTNVRDLRILLRAP